MSKPRQESKLCQKAEQRAGLIYERAVSALHRQLRWSPEQISGWLKQESPTHKDMQISHEAIYRSLIIQTRGVLKKELTAQLRTARRMPQQPQRQEWTGAYP